MGRQIAAVGIVIGVAVAAPVVVETEIAESTAETPVVIEVPRPGKVPTFKAAAEFATHVTATESAAHVAATESPAHMAATESATHMAPTQAPAHVAATR